MYSPAANRLLTWNGPETAGAKNSQLAAVTAGEERSAQAVFKAAAEVTLVSLDGDVKLGVTETSLQICLACDGSVINIPGLPPMYDYELSPQQVRAHTTSSIECPLSSPSVVSLQGDDGRDELRDIHVSAHIICHCICAAELPKGHLKAATASSCPRRRITNLRRSKRCGNTTSRPRAACMYAAR